jgi:penicillin-binding protein 1A
MNVPSIHVLDTIGFDAAINRAAALLGITDPEVKRRTFPRVYPLGLGISSVSPLQMARAFAIFANEGKEVIPVAIRTIEDRNGRVIVDNERDIRLRQRQKGAQAQVVSPQTAYVMTQLLKKTVEMGTLAGQHGQFTFTGEDGKKYRITPAGKTGTTQNWADAWTVGFTPYFTTAVWFGFDRPGNSLGLDLTGATLAGPIWGDYMREAHKGYPEKDFHRPSSGVVDIRVCAKSGDLLTPFCNEGSVVLTFLDKYRPSAYCAYHERAAENEVLGRNTIRGDIINLKDDTNYEYTMPTLNLDFLNPAASGAPADDAPLDPFAPFNPSDPFNPFTNGEEAVGADTEIDMNEMNIDEIDIIEAPPVDEFTE